MIMRKGLFHGFLRGDDSSSEPSRESRLIEAFFGFVCEYIPAGTKPDEVLHRFDVTEMSCRNRGLSPVLVAVDDILAGTLLDNVGIPLPEGDEIAQSDIDRISEYRRALIAEYSPENADKLIAEGVKRSAEMLQNEYFKKTLWESKVIEFDDSNTRMGAFRDLETQKTRELLLARIPADEPWHIAAWLPMGGWNGCPEPKDMLSVAKRWYDKYGAVICCVTSDEMEFHVSDLPAANDEALALAKEHFYFCEDRLTQYGGHYNLATLSDGLTKSSYWYFWWD